MMPRTTLAKAVGEKLVATFALGFLEESVLLIFESGYVNLVPRSDRDGDGSVQEAEITINDCCYGPEKYISAGIVSRQEIDAQEKANEEAAVAVIERRERETFKRLKAKFEPGQPL